MSLRVHRDVAEARELPHPPNRAAGDRPAQPTSEVGELLRLWVGAKMAEVDALVDEAHAKVACLPDQRALWSLVGETLVLLRALELEVAELRKGARR